MDNTLFERIKNAKSQGSTPGACLAEAAHLLHHDERARFEYSLAYQIIEDVYREVKIIENIYREVNK